MFGIITGQELWNVERVDCTKIFYGHTNENGKFWAIDTKQDLDSAVQCPHLWPKGNLDAGENKFQYSNLECEKWSEPYRTRGSIDTYGERGKIKSVLQ